MVRRTVILTLLVVMCCSSMVWALDADYYIKMGRLAIFEGEGSLSGLRMAYQTFDTGIKDPECTDCKTDRELKFLHALTGTAMLFIDNSDILVQDSFLELADQFGVTVRGDSFDPYDVDPIFIDVALDDANNYIVPPGAPQPEEVPGIINAMIPKIDALIAELESIKEPPTFTVIFTPSETGMQNNLEVDYGEVLILKGLLMALKAQIQAKLAYDVYIVDESLLHELLYVDGINTDNADEDALFAPFGIDDVNNIHINEDFLNPYPELLEVLPTSNDPNNGAAILAQARQDMMVAIEHYFNAINYIRSETDDQEDDLLYIDPNAEPGFQLVGDRLTILRDSLAGGTAGTYMWETTKTYDIYDSGSNLIGELVLVYDFTGLDGDTGSLTFTDPCIAPSPWEVDWFGKEYIDQVIIIEVDVEYYSGQWRQGFLRGTLINDENMIVNATFEYWGADDGKLTGLYGTLDNNKTVVTNKRVNPNPIFVSPGPVSPRDMLPVFNDVNEPVYGTFGHGLNDDPTLGGIFPDMTQHDWAVLFDLYPTGDFCGANSDQPDSYVDYWDLLYFAQRWHTDPSDTNWDPRCDLDKEDNYVDYWDLLVFARNWHIGEPP